MNACVPTSTARRRNNPTSARAPSSLPPRGSGAGSPVARRARTSPARSACSAARVRAASMRAQFGAIQAEVAVPLGRPQARRVPVDPALDPALLEAFARSEPGEGIRLRPRKQVVVEGRHWDRDPRYTPVHATGCSRLCREIAILKGEYGLRSFSVSELTDRQGVYRSAISCFCAVVPGCFASFTNGATQCSRSGWDIGHKGKALPFRQ
jgi:hypothetical protein